MLPPSQETGALASKEHNQLPFRKPEASPAAGSTDNVPSLLLELRRRIAIFSREACSFAQGLERPTSSTLGGQSISPRGLFASFEAWGGVGTLGEDTVKMGGRHLSR